MELDKAIKERRTIRKFSEKKPDWRDIVECIDSCRYAPMAGNDFTLKFIIVDEDEKIQELSEAAQQPFLAHAKYVVVVCSVISKTKNSYGERGEIYLRQQAGAAVENFLLKIHEKGLVSCWVGHFVEKIVKRILKIPENANVEVMLPVGYASKLKGETPRKRDKIDLDRILYFNEWKNKKMKPLGKQDV